MLSHIKQVQPLQENFSPFTKWEHYGSQEEKQTTLDNP